MRVWIVNVNTEIGDCEQYVFSSREKAVEYAKRRLDKNDDCYEECARDLETWGDSAEMYIYYADLDDEKDFNRSEYLKGF